MIPCEEQIEVVDGSGAIDLRGDLESALLRIDGEPFSYCWSTEEGTTMNRLLRLASTNSIRNEREYRHAIEADENAPSLESVLKHILPHLSSGHYTARLDDECGTFDIVDIWSATETVSEVESYYGGIVAYMLTQPRAILAESRIAHFCDLIRDDKRPVIVTISLSEDSDQYVLDGHHKLAAYRRLQVPSRYLNLARMDPPPVDFDLTRNTPKTSKHNKSAMDKPDPAAS